MMVWFSNRCTFETFWMCFLSTENTAAGKHRIMKEIAEWETQVFCAMWFVSHFFFCCPHNFWLAEVCCTNWQIAKATILAFKISLSVLVVRPRETLANSLYFPGSHGHSMGMWQGNGITFLVQHYLMPSVFFIQVFTKMGSFFFLPHLL